MSAASEQLLERGADPGAKNDKGETALDLAKAGNHEEVAARLAQALA